MTLTTEELRDGDMPFPREVWVGRPNDMDRGDVPCVLSKFATLPRWEGDMARDRDFQRYVDGDICDSAEKYYKGQIAALRAEVERLGAIIASLEARVSGLPSNPPVTGQKQSTLGKKVVNND